MDNGTTLTRTAAALDAWSAVHCGDAVFDAWDANDDAGYLARSQSTHEALCAAWRAETGRGFDLNAIRRAVKRATRRGFGSSSRAVAS